MNILNVKGCETATPTPHSFVLKNTLKLAYHLAGKTVFGKKHSPIPHTFKQGGKAKLGDEIVIFGLPAVPYLYNTSNTLLIERKGEILAIYPEFEGLCAKHTLAPTLNNLCYALYRDMTKHKDLEKIWENLGLSHQSLCHAFVILSRDYDSMSEQGKKRASVVRQLLLRSYLAYKLDDLIGVIDDPASLDSVSIARQLVHIALVDFDIDSNEDYDHLFYDMLTAVIPTLN